MGSNKIVIQGTERPFAAGDIFKVQNFGVCILASVRPSGGNTQAGFVALVSLEEGTQAGRGMKVGMISDISREVICQCAGGFGWTRVPFGSTYTLDVGEDQH